MSLHYRQQGVSIVVFGNTFPFKDRIKALGGRFDGGAKTWLLPFSEETLAVVAALCTESGGGSRAGATIQAPEPESPATKPGLSIRELMDRAAGAVASAFVEPVWVVGEIQNLSLKATGAYLDLAEGKGQAGHRNATITARAIIWGDTLRRITAQRGEETLKTILQDGTAVRVLCRVSLYRERGALSLAIEDIDPDFTKGAMALAREQLLKELRAKGLDQANKRRPLPVFPLRIGLISASPSRAMSDFVDQLKVMRYPGEIVFVPTPMQGEAVPQAVVRALATLAAAEVDLIVMTRGGGSAADLRWFDAREIAYAIASCPVPVIAAIGHHDDVAVAEEICFLRQKTPTAAADFVAGLFQNARERIDALADRLLALVGRKADEMSRLAGLWKERLALAATGAVESKTARLAQRSTALASAAETKLASGRSHLDILTQRLYTNALAGPQRLRAAVDQKALILSSAAETRMHSSRSVLDRLTSFLPLAASAHLSKAREQLASAEKSLVQRDPAPWMAKGWTALFGPRGPVRRLADAAPGDLLTARLPDGKLTLTVTAPLTASEEKSP